MKGHHSETILDFMRHGEPTGGRMYRGSEVDHPLSSAGWQQMHAAVSRHALTANEPAWDLIISSPMRRCYEFANTLSEQLSIPTEIHDDLTEISFGDWEGKTAEEIQASDPNLFRDFHRDPVNNRPSNSEPLEAFGARVIDALSRILKNHPGRNILLISHAGIMRTILIHVLSSPLKSRQSVRFPYAGMLRLTAKDQQFRLEFS